MVALFAEEGWDGINRIRKRWLSGAIWGERLETMKTRKSRFWIYVLILCVVSAGLLANAGRMLVVDAPQKSDLILVLAGETEQRPARALELLQQGYAPGILVDVPATGSIYGFPVMQLAEKYVDHLPQAGLVKICPIVGLSTRDETHDVEKCLAHEEVKRILIVTSEFHTRRALSIFRHELPDKSFSIAAAYDPTEFGVRWWSHRQWAKTFLDEWMRVAWWYAVDRWR